MHRRDCHRCGNKYYRPAFHTAEADIKNIAPAFFDETSKKYLDLYGYPEYCMITYNNEYREECTAYYVLYKKEIENFSRLLKKFTKNNVNEDSNFLFCYNRYR